MFLIYLQLSLAIPLLVCHQSIALSLTQKPVAETAPGYAICAFGWMSDYKGFWFHQTLQGCGSGIGFRDGSSWNPVGAYCCHQAAAIEREYVGSPVTVAQSVNALVKV